MMDYCERPMSALPVWEALGLHPMVSDPKLPPNHNNGRVI